MAAAELAVTLAATALRWPEEQTILFQRLLQNVLNSPQDAKFRSLKLSNARIGALMAEPGAEAAFLAMGWVGTRNGDTLESLQLPSEADLALTTFTLQTLAPSSPCLKVSQEAAVPMIEGTPLQLTVMRGPLKKHLQISGKATVAQLSAELECHRDLGEIPQGRQRILVSKNPPREIQHLREDGTPITMEELQLKGVMLEDMWEELVIELRSGRATFMQLSEIFSRPLLAALALRDNRDFVRERAEAFLRGRIADQSLQEVKAARRCFQLLWVAGDPATYDDRVTFCGQCAFATVAGSRPKLPSRADLEAMSLRDQVRAMRELEELEENPVEHFVLEVDRQDIFGSSIAQVLAASPEVLHRPLEVRFKDEVAEDAGGLRREFFNEFGRACGRAEKFWRLTPAGSLVPAPICVVSESTDAVTRQNVYRACGRIFGLALCQAQEAAPMQGEVGGNAAIAAAAEKPQPLLLGLPLAYNFVRAVQGDVAETVEHLQAALGMEQHEQSPDSRCNLDFKNRALSDYGLQDSLTFSHTTSCGHVVDLVPGGRNITVTDETKEAWLRASLKYELFDAVEEAAGAFRTGVCNLVGAAHLVLLSAPELRGVWSGKADVNDEDLVAWQARTDINPAVAKQAQWFFQLLQGDLRSARSHVLKFATGSDRWPLDPSGFRFEIQPVDGGDQTLPQAMTCANMLQLPRYSGPEALGERLLKAATLGVDLQKL